MKLSFLGLGFLFALLTGSASGCGSRRLGSVDSTADAGELKDTGSSLETSGGRELTVGANYTIPVYFWHSYSPGSRPNQILTNQTIYNQHFVALQRGFQNTPFHFELKGISIAESAVYGKCERNARSERVMKRQLRAPGKSVLNVYICDSTASDAGSWSSFPDDADRRPLYDGIVLKNPRLAATPAKSITAIENIVHETGHFLGKSTAQLASFVLFCALLIRFLACLHARRLLQDSTTPLKEDAMARRRISMAFRSKAMEWTTRLRKRLLLPTSTSRAPKRSAV
jgi:hypothetical protein